MRHRRWGTLLFLALTAGCGSGAIYHQVRPGENLYPSVRRNGVSYRAIAQANDLRDPSSIRGQRLRIPAPAAPFRGSGHSREASARARRADERSAGEPRFHWPLPDRHRGPRPSASAMGGSTTASTSRRRLAHSSGPLPTARWCTVRSWLAMETSSSCVTRMGTQPCTPTMKRNRVGEGDRVRAGQVIATVGRSGRTARRILHFEVGRTTWHATRVLPAAQRAGGTASRFRRRIMPPEGHRTTAVKGHESAHERWGGG